LAVSPLGLILILPTPGILKADAVHISSCMLLGAARAAAFSFRELISQMLIYIGPCTAVWRPALKQAPASIKAYDPPSQSQSGQARSARAWHFRQRFAHAPPASSS
jgi:hypothetical protein